MGLKTFKTIAQDSTAAERFQQNVDSVFTQVLAIPLLSGVLLEGVMLTAGQANMVEHKLGRPWRGLFVIAKDAESDVWQSTAQALPSKAVDVRCSADCTVSLWVF